MSKDNESHFCTALKALFVPAAVLACAFTLVALGWFEQTWIVIAYSALGLLVLFRWRKLTFSLDPSLSSVSWERLDVNSKRAITRCFVLIFGTAIAVPICLMLWLLLTPAAQTQTVLTLAVLTMVWISFVRFGLINLCIYVLVPR